MRYQLKIINISEIVKTKVKLFEFNYNLIFVSG